MKKYQNTFIAMLNLLKVKHTTVFSNNFFNEHPHKFNLYGLSMMLSDYRVRNAATRIKNIEVELQKHESWQEKTQLRATPTILVNGYKLPENYKIEDLRYVSEFNIDIKYSLP